MGFGRLVVWFPGPVKLCPSPGFVQFWPGPAVGGGPPASRLWKTRLREPLSKPLTSGLSSSSAFCAGDSRLRTSSYRQELGEESRGLR